MEHILSDFYLSWNKKKDMSEMLLNFFHLPMLESVNKKYINFHKIFLKMCVDMMAVFIQSKVIHFDWSYTTLNALDGLLWKKLIITQQNKEYIYSFFFFNRVFYILVNLLFIYNGVVKCLQFYLSPQIWQIVSAFDFWLG